MFSNLLHAVQLVSVTSDKVKEGQLVEVAELLIRQFHHLMIALGEGLVAQTGPELWPVDLLSHFNCHVQIAALERQLEPCLWILDELEGDLEGSACVRALA